MEKVKEIQALLEQPQLQYKELHTVRWFSMYAALETYTDHLVHLQLTSSLKWNKK